MRATAMVVTSQSFPLDETTSRASVQQGSLEVSEVGLHPARRRGSHGWRNIIHFSSHGAASCIGASLLPGAFTWFPAPSGRTAAASAVHRDGTASRIARSLRLKPSADF